MASSHPATTDTLTDLASPSPPWLPADPPNELVSPLQAAMETVRRAMSPASSDVRRLRGERFIFSDSIGQDDARAAWSVLVGSAVCLRVLGRRRRGFASALGRRSREMGGKNP